MKTLLILLFPFLSMAQFKLKSIEPREMKEGQRLVIQTQFEAKPDSLKISWGLGGNTVPSMSISSEGVFSWTPEPLENSQTTKTFNVFIKAQQEKDSLVVADSVLVSITVLKVNRPPVVPKAPELVWLSKANTEVVKTLPKEYYYDPEGSSLAFRLLENKYANIKLSPEGVLSVSLNNKEIRALPDTLFFEIFETNTTERLQSRQMIVLKKAEMDEAPRIEIIPDSPKYQIEEGDEILIEISINDENNDLKTIDFYTIPQTAFKVDQFLEKKSATNYVFKWKPSLDFVKSEEPSRVFQLVIAATDEAKQQTNKQIEVEIRNKIDWEREDLEREKSFNQVVMNGTEVYLRLESTFLAIEKDIKRIFKNKKLKFLASKTLDLISAKSELLKNENIKQAIKTYDTYKEDAKSFQNDDSKNIQAEFPAEFTQITRFTNIVDKLKTIFVDTEEFIEKYKTETNRRNVVFFNEKAELQTKISMIDKNLSLQLMPLKPGPIDPKRVFENL